MVVADFFSSAVGCAAWALAIAAPELSAATPARIANHRIKTTHFPDARAAPGFSRLSARAAPNLQGKWSRHVAAARKAYSVGHETARKGSRYLLAA
jgi:hypothetical protein